MRQLKVLFIAKNIPTPEVNSNAIVLTIAKEISSFSKVHFLFPKEWLPYGFQYISKYKSIYKLKGWKSKGFSISVLNYPRLPFKQMAYALWTGLSKKDNEFYKKEGPFDLIHAHYLLPDGYFAYLFSKKYKVPYIITIRNADMRFLERSKSDNSDFKKAYKVIINAERVLTLNLAYKNYIDNLFGINALVIPHGIEEEALYEKEKASSEILTISCVSQFDEKKNVGWVIDAVKNYKGEVPIQLNIIGSGRNEEGLKEQARNSKRIRFLGRLSRVDVLDRLKSSDIFALPSSEESFGLVYLEAAATKNAIIGYEKEGIWGVLEENKEALFCRDQKHFEDLLHTLIDNPKLRLDLENSSFSKAKMLNWKNIANEYKKVYSSSIS